MVDQNVGCPNDGNQVAPGRWLCKDCERDYLRRLKALNGLMQALDSVAMREARIGSQGRRPTTGFAPSPIDWTADTLRDDAAYWMRLVLSRVYVGHGLIPLNQWRRMWVGLVARRNTILTLDTAPYDYSDLVHVTDRIDRRLTPQPDRILWGHCPECDAKIYAPRRARYAGCPGCGAALRLADVRVAYLDRAAETELGSAAKSGMHITRTQSGAAEWLTETVGRRFTATQVKKWRQRKKLPSCKRLDDGYWEWSIGELLACAGGL